MQRMHKKRIDNTRDNTQKLRTIIDDFIASYEHTHNGRTPSMNHIAAHLNENEIPSPQGKEAKWYAQTVKRVIERTTEHQR